MTKRPANNLINLAQRARELGRMSTLSNKAANSEATKAVALGLLYLHGEAVERNPAKAAAFLAKAAKGGIAQARHELALLHLKEEGVEYDAEYAIRLLQSASDDGYVASSVSLAELYLFGSHCPRDTDKAVELLYQAVSENEPAAMYYLAYIYDREPEFLNSFEAAYWYRRAADYGHFKSQIRLAALYATGSGVPLCLETARAFLRVAMESSGQQDPQFMFWQGKRLVAQPETEFVAKALIKAAAAMKYSPAQRLLLQRGWSLEAPP